MSKRIRFEVDTETESSKRYRSAIDEVAEEFLCPITQELPLDPVTAEDGRVYERAAIEDWLNRNAGPVKSPVTNEVIGRKLLPAVQIRNSIKNMVKSGAISGSKADAWKQRLEDEGHVAAVRRRAEDGNAYAMSQMGFWYRDGQKGLAVDKQQAFTWSKRAADLGHAVAMTSCGVAYWNARGVEKNVFRGTCMLAQAAALGSQHACFLLGSAHKHGRHGADKDDAETTRWFRKMQGCQFKDSGETALKEAGEWLREKGEASS